MEPLNTTIDIIWYPLIVHIVNCIDLTTHSDFLGKEAKFDKVPGRWKDGSDEHEWPCERFRNWRKKETSGIVESQIHNSINQKCPIRLPIAVLSFPANSDGNHVPAELEQGNLSRVHHIFWNGNQNRGTQSDLKPSCTNYSGFFKTWELHEAPIPGLWY